jgi:hypothetical protein
MKFTETIKERLLSGLGGMILGVGGMLGASLLKDAYPPFEQNVLPAISKGTLLLLSLLLLMTNLVCGAWLVALLWGDREKRILDKYEFLPDRGFFKNKKTGAFFCGSCLAKGIESPLVKLQAGPSLHWECVNKDCGRVLGRMTNE